MVTKTKQVKKQPPKKLSKKARQNIARFHKLYDSNSSEQALRDRAANSLHYTD